MKATLYEDYFSTEDEAFAEIAARGWHAIELQMDDDTDFHWHDFNTVAYILSGELTVEYTDGTRLTAGPGTKAEAAGWTLHREIDSQYRVVFGFDIPLESFTQPIDKPPELLPADRRR